MSIHCSLKVTVHQWTTSSFIQIMAWWWSGTKPWYKPLMTSDELTIEYRWLDAKQVTSHYPKPIKIWLTDTNMGINGLTFFLLCVFIYIYICSCHILNCYWVARQVKFKSNTDFRNLQYWIQQAHHCNSSPPSVAVNRVSIGSDNGLSPTQHQAII